MRSSARALALVLLFAAGSVAAQDAIDPRLATRLDARTRTAVVAILDSARMQRLPVEPLIDKALEGAAKKAASQQIVTAVHTFMGQLRDAREVLGASSTPLELLSGAQAIRAGIPTQQLERLRRARSNAQIATALTVVSDLVAREVPVDTAVLVVSRLVNAAASDDQLLAVRANIENDILNGKPPVLAATSWGDAMGRTLAGTTPPNGGGAPGSLPSASGSTRPGDPTGSLKPPSQAVGSHGNAGAPTKPSAVTPRKRP